MNNIWSKNKYVECVIDILLYFMSMNFLHYGQLLLPIICLVIFINNRFRFNVANKNVFVVLCLFAISFFAFSYELGSYCVMGFCFPMAYYIGSNIKDVSEEKIVKVVYIIIAGMVTHYFLNFIYELMKFGWHRTMVKSTRYDIWLQDAFVTTGTATNAVILLSIIYYLALKEKNKTHKTIGIIMFAFTLFYTVILRRRIQLGILVIVFIVSLIIDILFNKKIDKRSIIKLLLVILALFVLLFIFYIFNILGFRTYVLNNSVIAFIKREGMNSGRLSIIIKGIKYLPIFPWGGQHISTIIENPFHDLLLNIYDYSGIITTILMIVYLILCSMNIYKVLKKDSVSFNFKLLITEIFLGYAIMFFVEPLMTGSSLFLIVGILIEACTELLM